MTRHKIPDETVQQGVLEDLKGMMGRKANSTKMLGLKNLKRWII